MSQRNKYLVLLSIPIAGLENPLPVQPKQLLISLEMLCSRNSLPYLEKLCSKQSLPYLEILCSKQSLPYLEMRKHLSVVNTLKGNGAVWCCVMPLQCHAVIHCFAHPTGLYQKLYKILWIS